MNDIIYKNIIKRPVRSFTLMLLAAILSITIFAGTIIVEALQNGFSSLNNRLGADIMVVPYEATTKKDLESIVIQGNTGYFYMDSKYLDEISEMEGVGQITPQYYLATVKAGCCSIPVQIIGFDPETDFAIMPWIKKSNGSDIGYLDVVVGNDLNAFVGDTLSFFGVEVNVVAKLDKTGTSYDTEVFATQETVKTLIDESLNKQLNEYANINSGDIVSCILINAADGYDVEDVMNEINIHLKKVRAVRTTNMIAGISDSLSSVADIIGILMVVIWIIALVILVVAYAMISGERRKEFAVFRVIGASRKKLFRMVFFEGVLTSLIGSVAGVVLAVIIIVPFSNYIETKLSLPFLLPSFVSMLVASLGAVALTVITGAITSGISAKKISNIDTGTILRMGE